MADTYHIALAFDDNYMKHSIVLMTSILANKGDEHIYFHILDGGLNDNSKKTILSMKNCVIEFHKVDMEMFKNYKKADYYPVSMLWTMILPDLIPVERLIYLDSDMVVNTSLKELWETDLGDNYIAAVEDANGKKYIKKFGMKSESKFFNSGTMLLNCKKWRDDNICSKAVEMSMANTGTRMGFDQTVLNILFEGKVLFLNYKWNLQFCPLNVWPTYDDKDVYKSASKNPSIIHYVGDFKPWTQGRGCFNPKQDDYLKYLQMTGFAQNNLNIWKLFDKLTAYKGIFAFIKRYPLFFLRKQFWKNLFF